MLSTAAASRCLIPLHHPFRTTQTLSRHVWAPAQGGDTGEPPRREFHHLGNAFGTSFPSTSTETYHKPPERKQGIILEGSQGKEGSSPSSRRIPASQRCLCICRSIPNPSPRASLPYCSLIALLRKRGALTAWLMSTGGTDPFGCDPVPQGDPVPCTQRQDTPAAPRCVGIPPRKSQFRGCREPPRHPL